MLQLDHNDLQNKSFCAKLLYTQLYIYPRIHSANFCSVSLISCFLLQHRTFPSCGTNKGSWHSLLNFIFPTALCVQRHISSVGSLQEDYEEGCFCVGYSDHHHVRVPPFPRCSFVLPHPREMELILIGYKTAQWPVCSMWETGHLIIVYYLVCWDGLQALTMQNSWIDGWAVSCSNQLCVNLSALCQLVSLVVASPPTLQPLWKSTSVFLQ